MTLADNLAEMASGARATGDWLLGTAALTTASGDVYGEEAIITAFCRRPLTLGGTVVRTPRGVALFGVDGALFADVFDGHVARVWRVGGAPGLAERRVDVAFDPDLAQRRGDVFADAGAVDLDAARLDQLTAAVLPLLPAGDSGAFRRRAFVIRAFADDDTTAGLIAMYAATGAGIGFHYVALALAAGTMLTVTDPAANQPWSPRL